MELRKRITFAVLALASSPCFATLEFSAYIKSEKSPKFIVADPAQAKISGWLSIGQSFEKYTLVAFDQAREVLTLRAEGATVELPLRLSRVRGGPAATDLDAFRSFFSKPGPITADEVEARFGRPSRYSPALLNEELEDATRDHSQWGYLFDDKGRGVGVFVDKAKVQMVVYYYFDKNDVMMTEVIRKPLKS
jgi:hypothetical protein